MKNSGEKKHFAGGPSEEQVEIATEDRHSFKAHCFTPPGDPGNETLVFFPAMGVRAGYYRGFAEEMARRGLNVLLADLRGNGTWDFRPTRKKDFGYREMLEYDWPAAVSAASEYWPGSRVTPAGHSLGGQLGLLYLAFTGKREGRK